MAFVQDSIIKVRDIIFYNYLIDSLNYKNNSLVAKVCRKVNPESANRLKFFFIDFYRRRLK